MSKPDFRRLNTRIAYPWPVDAEMPQDVSGMGIDETLYGPGADQDGFLGGFVLGWHELGDDS